MVCPLALPEPDDDALPVVDMGDAGPVRCGRCKAYVNPFMRFMASGKTFVCNFCGHTNATPDAYFCHLGPDGQRRDVYERPELFRGSVEFAATKEYMLRPPMPNAHFFVLEATPGAVASGALASAAACVSKALSALPCPERALVGVATFDAAVQFYGPRPGGAPPSMLVMSDVAEPFVPDSAPVVVPLTPDNLAALQALLEQVPKMFGPGGGRGNDSCGGAAVEAAVAAMERTGGKVHAFVATLPTVGVHALKLRDAAGVGEKDKLTVLAGQDSSMKALAQRAADLQVGAQREHSGGQGWQGGGWAYGRTGSRVGWVNGWATRWEFWREGLLLLQRLGAEGCSSCSASGGRCCLLRSPLGGTVCLLCSPLGWTVCLLCSPLKGTVCLLRSPLEGRRRLPCSPHGRMVCLPRNPNMIPDGCTDMATWSELTGAPTHTAVNMSKPRLIPANPVPAARLRRCASTCPSWARATWTSRRGRSSQDPPAARCISTLRSRLRSTTTR
eukprot:356074-Chlamydomonas_euryale.AAC.1